MTAPVGSLVNVVALGQLGVGKLRKYDELGRAVVYFDGEGTRILAPRTPTSRARLSDCTRVRFETAAGTVSVGEILHFLIQREDGGFVYRVVSDGQIYDVWEGQIMPVGETTDPMQLLKSYRWDTPRNYIARWSMADIYSRWCATSGGLPAMLGSRVIPLGHQIYAARRVLFDRTPRFILADEVGLGKTIEAGMIIQALVAPDAYADQSPTSLQVKYDRQSAVWDRLNFTRKLIDAAATEGRELDSEEVEFVAEEWVGLIGGDRLFDALLDRMRAGEAQAAIELVAYVQEFHRLDHRIIRTRRATLASETTRWPDRILVELPWAASPAEAIFLNHLQEMPEGAGPQAAAVRALYPRCLAS
jgi:hypothetical protein